MVRPQDKKKISKLLRVLIKHPEGLWLRQISKDTKIAPSTVHYYINQTLSEIVENIGVKDKKGKYFGLRIVRLKPKIIENAEKGGLENIFHFLKLSKKI